MTRKHLCDPIQCAGCGACYNICPVNAISMEEDEFGFIRPVIDEKKCIDCGLCDMACPVLNPPDLKRYLSPIIYAGWSINDEIRMKSTSGGIFLPVAEYIIENGGVVAGAAFDNEFNVAHKCIMEKDRLYELSGSKYTQSNIGRCYNQIKMYLEKGKLVLFSGTPCQVAGLYGYLRNSTFDNLFTIDVVCLGVGSSGMFKEYLQLIKRKYKSSISYVFFRDKSKGWDNYAIFKIKFKNGQEYKIILGEEGYTRGWASGLIRRSLCFNCPFNKIPRVGDITLGDFWGIEKIDSRFLSEIKRGISIVLVNSKKGEELLAAIQNKVDLIQINKSLTEIAKYNPRIIYGNKPQVSQKILELRKKLLEEYKKYGYEYVDEYFFNSKGKSKISYLLLKVLGKRRFTKLRSIFHKNK